MALDVEMLTVGQIGENCFLFRPQGGERLLIVDPGEEAERILAAVIFAVLLILIFGRPAGAALLFGAFMLVFYVPAGYYIDMALWRRRERARIRARQQ